MWLSLIYVVTTVDWLEKLKGRNFNVVEIDLPVSKIFSAIILPLEVALMPPLPGTFF